MTKGDIALLKALRDTLDNMLFEPVLGITKKAMNQAITELEQIDQQPCEDCVSRQAVKDIIHEYKNNIDSQLSWLSDGVCDLPPVTPTFPEGFTNGDVMEIMFPNYKFSNNFGYIDTVLNGRSYSFCPVEFWNTPYKRGNEE